MTAAAPDPTRYPLAWPSHKGRTRWQDRKSGKFRSENTIITVARALARVDIELNRLGASYPLISSNLELRVDGRPRSDRGEPGDPGVCVYFMLKGKPYAMACDSYDRVAQNIAAIAAHLEASRAIERYGVATAAETLQAFTALPPPSGAKPKRPWWEVLGVQRDGADVDGVKAMFRSKANKAHPDRGGTADAMSELSEALREALAEVG